MYMLPGVVRFCTDLYYMHNMSKSHLAHIVAKAVCDIYALRENIPTVCALLMRQSALSASGCNSHVTA